MDSRLNLFMFVIWLQYNYGRLVAHYYLIECTRDLTKLPKSQSKQLAYLPGCSLDGALTGAFFWTKSTYPETSLLLNYGGISPAEFWANVSVHWDQARWKNQLITFLQV